tara:strand:+ start:449 stop:619 length:171 start_codon:yes stop_codon:yes gene_type:complete
MPIFELKKEKKKGKGAPKKKKKDRRYGFPNMQELNRAVAVSKGRAMKRGGKVKKKK